jgi:hypothetical protein
MFLGNNCAWDSQNIANLFAGFFQSAYVRDDWIPDSDLPTLGDGHKMSAIKVSKDEVKCAFLGLDVNKGPSPDGWNTSYYETVGFGCQSSFNVRF